MSLKAASIGILVAILAATGFAAEHSGATTIVARDHFAVIEPDGTKHVASEIVFVGDVDAFATLWQTSDGKRYIMRYTENNPELEIAISIAEVHSTNFVRLTYPIPVPPGSAAEVKQRKAELPSGVKVPVTVFASGYQVTAPVPASASIARIGVELRQHLDPAFLRAAAKVVVLASGSGSPAARNVCSAIGPLLASGASCRRSKEVNVTPLDQDCEFDAKFGYWCEE